MVEFEQNGSVRFQFKKPGRGGRLYLVGDFNNWDETSHPMKKTEKGQWELDVRLRAGAYCFLYRDENSWYVDSESPYVDNPWGSEYSVVRVPQKSETDNPPPSSPKE